MYGTRLGIQRHKGETHGENRDGVDLIGRYAIRDDPFCGSEGSVM